MKTIAITICLVTLTALSACSASTPASTPAVVTDTFFSAQALLDTNGNRQIDEEDTPLAGAAFIIRLSGGAEFGAQSGEDGSAFITIPARVEYPVTARMEAPADSGLNIVEPSVITLKEPTGKTLQFLFVQP